MNQITDDILLAKSGYEYSPYISFKNPHIKKANEALEKAFLRGNSLPEMITNGFFALLEYPLDVLDGYFKHLQEQQAEKQKALKTERANWDAEQLKAQKLSKNDVFLLLGQTVLTAHAAVPNLLQNQYPDFYEALPKDQNNHVLYGQLSMKQKQFIKKASQKTMMDSFHECLNKTFNRQLTAKEVKYYENVITKMGYHPKKMAGYNPFINKMRENQH